MENTATDDEVVIPPPRWKRLLRQNSERIGVFAEDVVLPRNQRSHQRTHIPEVELQDVEVHNPNRPTVHDPKQRPVQMQPKHFPIFIIGISIIQVVLMYIVDNEILTLLFAYDPHRRHEIWRYLTDALAHTGLPHLWSNILLQVILGVLIEIVHNWKRISIIYWASVLGGSLFMSVLSPNEYVVGASAAVYGLLFSHLSTIILNWDQMDRKRCRLFCLVLYIVFNFLLEFMTDAHSSLAGHLGGAITGFLVSIFVLKNFEKHPWEEKMRKICFGILITLCVIIIIINVTASDLYPPTEWNFHYTSTFENYLISLVSKSALNSTVRKQCDQDLRCKLLMVRGNITSTYNST